MELIANWGWWYYEPSLIPIQVDINLPAGLYSAFCGITLISTTESPLPPGAGAQCGINQYTSTDGTVTSPDLPLPFLFPTELDQLSFWGTAGLHTMATWYIYISAWQ